MYSPNAYSISSLSALYTAVNIRVLPFDFLVKFSLCNDRHCFKSYAVTEVFADLANGEVVYCVFDCVLDFPAQVVIVEEAYELGLEQVIVDEALCRALGYVLGMAPDHAVDQPSDYSAHRILFVNGLLTVALVKILVHDTVLRFTHCLTSHSAHHFLKYILPHLV